MAYIGFDVENRLHNTAFTFDSYTSDGVTSIYALSVPKPLTSRAVLVSFDGLTQQPELDYTLDGESNLKIINVPVNTTQIQILHLTRPVQLHTIPDKSIVKLDNNSLVICSKRIFFFIFELKSAFFIASLAANLPL